jgi:GT2 family glycosyltransferase
MTMRLAVIVASIRRAEEIEQLLQHLARQTILPSAIVLSVEKPSDAPARIEPHVQLIMGPKGLTGQRNRGLDLTLDDADIVVFFDDDFVPADDAVANIIRLFELNPDVIGATGEVLRDGVKQGGLSYEDAVLALEAHKTAAPRPEKTTDVGTHGLYGCNMAFRAAAIRTIRFDEKLPLYAWQEDVDFAGQLMNKGRIVKTTAFCGVHRGVNKGRSPGFSLGYSQMVNPSYLVRKGTMRPSKAAQLMAKNFIANHVKALAPEVFIDRSGRVRGNWRGLWDVVRGKGDPGKILTL